MSKVSCQWSKVEVTGETPSPRVGHSVAVCKNDAYIFGGSCIVDSDTKNDVRYFNDVYKLSVGAEKIEWVKLQCRGTTPSPRDYHTSICYDNYLWIFGGKNNPSCDECLPGVFRLSIKTLTWEEVSTTGPAPKSIGFSLSLAYDNAITFGGLENGQPTNDMFLLNLKTKSWVPIRANGSPPEPRCDHSTAVVNDDVFVFGGASDANTYLNDLHRFNIETMSWHLIEERGAVPDCSAGHSLVAHHDKDIYVIGGCQSPSEIVQAENVFKFSLTNGKWKRPLIAGEGPLTAAINGHCCILLHSKIYVIGGIGVKGEIDMKFVHVLQLINPSERKSLLNHFLTETQFLDNQHTSDSIREEQSDCLSKRAKESTLDKKIAHFDKEEVCILQSISKMVGDLLDETLSNANDVNCDADLHKAYKEKIAKIIDKFGREREACLKLMKKERIQVKELITRFKEQNNEWWKSCLDANLRERESIKKSWDEMNDQRALLDQERFHLEQKATMLNQLLKQL